MYKVVKLFFYIAAFIAFGAATLILKDVSQAVSNPESYRFGSVSMLAQWGQAYSSLTSYVDSSLTTAFMFYFCSLLLACFGSIPFFLKDNK